MDLDFSTSPQKTDNHDEIRKTGSGEDEKKNQQHKVAKKQGPKKKLDANMEKPTVENPEKTSQNTQFLQNYLLHLHCSGL